MSNSNKKVIKGGKQVEEQRQPTPVESAVDACMEYIKKAISGEKLPTQKEIESNMQKIRDKYYQIEGDCLQEFTAPLHQQINNLARENELLKVQLNVMTEQFIRK